MDGVFKRWGFGIQTAMLRLKMALGRGQSNALIECEKEDIVKDAKTLSSDYIEDRLIRSGLNMKQRKVTPASLHSIKETTEKPREKPRSGRVGRLSIGVGGLGGPRGPNVTLQTLESLLDKRNDSEQSDLSVNDVSKVLICVGEYLELRHNGLYTDVLQQLNVRSLVDVNLNRLFMNVAKEIFSKSITWAKIVSLFAFAGGLAVDCVLGGSPMHVGRVKNWTTEFIENELLEWIQHQGGWVAMFDHFMTKEDPEESPSQFYWTLSAIVLVVSVILTAAVAVHLKRN